MTAVELRNAIVDDAPGAAAVVAAAFAEYPHWVWVEPDPIARSRAQLTFYRADLVEMLALGASHVVTDEGRVVAAAVWTLSTALPDEWGASALGGLEPVVAQRLGRALAAMAAMAPPGPHWYLDLLAVEPARQGRGLGRHVMAPGIERADADGLGCYLETARADNVRFYGRIGFEILAESDLDDVRLWGLWRPPRPFVRPGTSLV